jgi:hypothetical protein
MWYMHGTKSNQTPPQAAHDAAAPPLSPALIAAINTNHHMSPRATAAIDNRSVAIYTSDALIDQPTNHPPMHVQFSRSSSSIACVVCSLQPQLPSYDPSYGIKA